MPYLIILLFSDS